MALQLTVRVRPAAAAAPVVGWPPVRSFRRNLASSSSSRPSPQSSSGHHRHHKVQDGGLFVKINMDGVPIGRKVDLTAYGGYADLSAAVGKLFRGLLAGTYARAAGPVSCKNGACPSSHQAKNCFFSPDRAAQRDPSGEAAAEEVQEPVIGGDYTLVYEDEEGDRVLVGDVPWE